MNSKAFGRHSRVVAALAAIAAGLGANQAWGSGFALQEQNASGLGHAFAGGAAAAEDVSTIWFNPAGLVRLTSPQVVIAANAICPSDTLHDSGSQPAAFQPLGGTGGDAGSCAGVPNMYIGVPFADKWSFGLAVNVPFGLKTQFDPDWLGRFQAVKSEIQTINVNPALSWEPTPHLTVGAGVSFQHLKATLSNKVNYAALYAQGVGAAVAGGLVPAAAAPALIGAGSGLETDASVSGSDSAWGWNIGVLWQASEQTRFGAAYRSQIKYNVSGNVDFSNPSSVGALPPTLAPVGAAILNNVSSAICTGTVGATGPVQSCSSGVNLAIKMPDTANVSVFHQFNNQWDLMADLQYTGWSVVNQLQIVRDTGAVLSTTPENWRDTWRIAAGANYRYTDQWTFRGGVAYDQTPVRDEFRTPRLPDSDRTWLAVGAQYKPNPNWAFDVGYTHIFMKDGSINQDAGSQAAYGLILGSFSNEVNLVGVQLTYTFK